MEKLMTVYKIIEGLTLEIELNKEELREEVKTCADPEKIAILAKSIKTSSDSIERWKKFI